MESSMLRRIEAAVHKVSSVANRMAGVVVVLLVVLLVADVFGRFVGYPVLGSYEIVQYGFGLIVCLSLAYAGVAGGHIVIDLIYGLFPKRVQRVFGAVSEILSVVMFALIVWRLVSNGSEAYRISERSTTLNIPIFFFEYALAAGFALLALVILLHFLRSMGGKE